LITQNQPNKFKSSILSFNASKPKWSIILVGLLAFLAIWLAYQVPATFYLDAKGDTSYFHNFYPAEQTNEAATSYRWGTTGAGLLFPPLSSANKVTLRLSTIPRPGQPEETPLVIQVDGKEVARLNLRPGWQEYSFKLDKKLAGPGHLDLMLDAPAFQVKGDRRLFTVAFGWLRIESQPNPIVPLGSLLSCWLTVIFVSSFKFQVSSSRFHLSLSMPWWGGLIAALAMGGLIAFGREWLAWGWLGLLLVAGGVALVGWAGPRQDGLKSGRWLAVVLLVAAFVRLYQLDLSPLGILPDEAVLGYDAWSVFKTGYDHHGIFWPLYFRAFNDYEPGVPIYTALPSVAVFGLNLWAIRLPFALLGVGTCLFAYALARELFSHNGKRADWSIGLLAALFVAVSPWAVSQSRLAMPVSPLSFFFLGGFWLFLRAKRKTLTDQKAAWAWVGSGLLLGLSVWTYPTMKFIVALFVTGLLLVYGRFFWHRRTAFARWAGPFALVCLPFSLVMLADWAVINYRFSLISVWARHNFWDGLGLFATNYLAHYDPLRLFFKLTGDYTVTMSSRPAWIGVVSPALAIPALIGLGATFSPNWRKQPAIWLLWLWLLIFPLGSALTAEDVPDEMRAMSGVGLFEILAAFGAWWLWQKLRGWQGAKLPLNYVAASLFALAFVVSSAAYLHFTLVSDPTHGRAYFRYGFGQALAETERQVQPGGKICLETTSQGYILALFYRQYDPARYQALARQNDPPPATPYNIKAFDKYEFNCEELKPGDVGLVRYPKGGATPLWQNFYPDGQTAWWIIK